MAKKSIISLFSVIGLALVITACQSLPGFNIFSSGQETAQTILGAYFVPHLQTVYAQVDQPQLVNSYYLSSGERFGLLEVWVNDQKITFEHSKGKLTAKYPPSLSLTPLPIDQCEPNQTLAILQVMTPTIQITDTARLEVLPARYPNTTWPVTLSWQGCVPGIYDLRLLVKDQPQSASQEIKQRIEVR